MFQHMPLILIGIIVLIISIQGFIPDPLQSFLYGVSLSIKSLIIFLLPFIIFGLLFKAAVNLASHATKIIFLILIGICCSNFLSTFLSHYVLGNGFISLIQLLQCQKVEKLSNHCGFWNSPKLYRIVWRCFQDWLWVFLPLSLNFNLRTKQLRS